MQDYITGNTILAGAIGFLVPILLPVLFGFIERIFKKALSSQTKKLIVLGVSLIIVLTISLINFDWSGESIEVLVRFAQAYLVDNAIFLGMVNNVYVMMVRFFPSIDQRLEVIENAVAGKKVDVTKN